MPPKRKRSSVVAMSPPVPPLKRRASSRNQTTAATNPDVNGDIIDAPNAARASPDNEADDEIVPGPIKKETSESPLSDTPAVIEDPKKKLSKQPNSKKAKAAEGVKKAAAKVSAVVDAAVAHAEVGTAAPKKGRGEAKLSQVTGEARTETAATPLTKQTKKSSNVDDLGDPEAEGEEEAGEEEIKEALSRPPPVHSDYLPLVWKGRLGYACLNTYLRQSNPPVFSSRTCRIASILEHRHPLKDPSQPEHASKNRPDRTQPASVERGRKYLEEICLANVKDIAKMIRWNDRYNIKFFRLSSEMFPFASHPEYGYKLAPFASDALAEAGKVIAKLGHRVTTHPGQFTQLGSPRKSVIANALRDLAYHDEMFSLLNLPEQQNRDAVMILHMGGVFDGKDETLNRFRENYKHLSPSIKNRLVLENDDVSWSVHDLLPVCEELNIPLVLDYHHHNIIFDSTQIREGTKDIIDLYPRIKATWDRKGITQKMHYSEPTPAAITGRQRRKHSPRVATLPPCAPDMDLMIEAKDKEQAVFELMRTFKLPGYDTFNDILPYVRQDDNKNAAAEQAKLERKKSTLTKKTKKSIKAENDDDDATSIASEPVAQQLIPEDEVGMGGSEGRVYWPPTMEEWLRPRKREVKKKDPSELTPAQKKKQAAADYATHQASMLADGLKQEDEEQDIESDDNATPATKKAKAAMRAKDRAAAAKAANGMTMNGGNGVTKEKPPAKSKTTANAKAKRAKKEEHAVPTPSASDEELSGLELSSDEGEQPGTPAVKRTSSGARKSGRAGKGRVSYAEDAEDLEMDEA